MPSSNYAYVNGRFLPESEATVSIFDRGFLYGDGVFETMRVYGGRIFRALEHFDRLHIGLEALKIKPELSQEELRAVCRALIEKNEVAEGVARVYVTRDSIVATLRRYAAQPVQLQAMISTVRIDPRLSRFKTANRLPYLLAQQEAVEANVNDAVLLNTDGRVVEFTTSNLFVVKDGGLFTPPLTDGPLPGITRHAVLGLAAEKGIATREHSFGREFLENADEVFATNSLMEITSIVTWTPWPKITLRLQKAYRTLVAKELNTPEP
jgi:branched-subunit amino acid aminotransferase/4-amino-4-deoxychorismate lyase